MQIKKLDFKNFNFTIQEFKNFIGSPPDEFDAESYYAIELYLAYIANREGFFSRFNDRINKNSLAFCIKNKSTRKTKKEYE